MTREVLSALLSCGVLAVGLYTALIANENHARAERLDRLQRECEELEAVRARREARARAHVPGQTDAPPLEGGPDAAPAPAWSPGS